MPGNAICEFLFRLSNKIALGDYSFCLLGCVVGGNISC